MTKGFPVPPGKKGELIAAVIAGQPVRQAAKRLGIPPSTAAEWWAAFRTERMGAKDGKRTDTTDPLSLPPPDDPLLDAWVMHWLGRSIRSMYQLSEYAGREEWALAGEGNRVLDALSGLAALVTQVYELRQRVQAAGSGAELESPAAPGDLPGEHRG